MCVIISKCFAVFKNVVHSLEPGEAPKYVCSLYFDPKIRFYLNSLDIFSTIINQIGVGCFLRGNWGGGGRVALK